MNTGLERRDADSLLSLVNDMISLDTFALSSKTLDRSLLEDFIRGEIDLHTSKIVKPTCPFPQTHLQCEALSCNRSHTLQTPP